MSDDAANRNVDSLEELIALYALDALEGDDQAQVERRLASDARARAMLDDMRQTISQLHAGEASVEPPARMKQRLFARVDADLASRGLQVQRERAWDRLARLLRAASPVFAAAALVLAIGLGAWGISLQQQVSATQQQLSTTQQQLSVAQQQLADNEPKISSAQQQLADTQQQLSIVQQQIADCKRELAVAQEQLQVAQQQFTDTQQQLASAQEQLTTAQQHLALLQQPGLRTAAIPRADTAPTAAQATLILAPDSQSALLAASGLPKLDPSQTYEFWLIRDGTPVPAGIFNVDAQGNGRLLVQSNEPIERFQQAGITVERAGGAAAPTLSELVFIGAIR